MKIIHTQFTVRIIVTLSILSLLTNCSDELQTKVNANDFYHLEIDNAWIPVMVRGNTKSGVILIYVQGGPGYPSIDYALVDYPRWKNTVEKDYAIAYYDQRGFGNKQGNSELSTLTMVQYQKDLLQIARFLKSRYTDSKIVLFAHSWGASLSYQYMINLEEQNAVDGLISICGPFTHDGDNVSEIRWKFRHEYLVNVADVLIAKGSDVDYWNDAKRWALDNDPIATAAQRKQWNKYVSKAEKFTETAIGLEDYARVGFASPYNIFSSLQYDYNDEVATHLIQDEQRSNIADDLIKIEKPVLMIGARFDDQAPLEELRYIFGRLGSQDKTFRQFDDAGHNVFLDDREGFRKAVSDFCSRL